MYQHHQPISVGYKIVYRLKGLEQVSEPVIYTGNNCVNWFLDKLEEEEIRLMEILLDPKRIIMRPEDDKSFEEAKDCWICHKAFHGNEKKVRDHDHITGSYRGAAHNLCNIRLRTQYKIPVFFHNFRGYDSHLLVWGFLHRSNKKINIIGQGMEKYLLLEWGNHIQFKDTLQFLPDSLERLVENLKSDTIDKFAHLKSAFPNASPNQIQLLKQKGIYPYDWMDNEEKLKQDHLPKQSEFDSLLRNETCCAEDYERAKKVWTEFQLKSFLEYHELYLKGFYFFKLPPK